MHHQNETLTTRSNQQTGLHTARYQSTPATDYGELLVSLELTFHRWVLSEFNTHCVLSRNSASSRAIPVRRRLAKVRNHETARPVVWAAEQRGMQGGDELDSNKRFEAEMLWQLSADAAADKAEQLMGLGLHKSLTNRLLEPYLYQTVLASGTEWEGFIKQRASWLAQPEIQVIGHIVKQAFEYAQSWTARSEPGAWHLPYVRKPDFERIVEERRLNNKLYLDASVMQMAAAVSAARAARTSYLTHDGYYSVEADFALTTKLLAADPMHASPFEHQALALPREQRFMWPGKFAGFAQLRHFVELDINPFERWGKLLK